MEKCRILKYDAFSKFEQKNYNEGIMTLTLSSWEDFHDVVKIFDNNPNYLWRGQKDEKDLKSSFDKKFPNKDEKERKAELKKRLEVFKHKLQDLPDKPPLNDNEIWAIGQHYGLETPFLDWTENPYIAAYFAFYKKDAIEQAGSRVIYALNVGIQRLILKKIHKPSRKVLSKERLVKFDDKNNLDRIQNKRLNNQEGRFTESLNSDDIKVNVRRLYEWELKHEREPNQKVILAEILIHGRFQDKCLEYLKSVGKTHGRLFPDYSGAVAICKKELGE